MTGNKSIFNPAFTLEDLRFRSSLPDVSKHRLMLESVKEILKKDAATRYGEISNYANKVLKQIKEMEAHQ